jgi:dimethylhistidine N-methyltransferase
MKTTAAPLSGPGRSPASDGFLHNVLHGLRRRRKRLPCKYFYDDAGSALFDRICELDEYYLTRCELDLLRRHAAEMADAAGRGAVLIEYGSGSSLKTRLLLDQMREPAAYVPVDISGEHLGRSAARLRRRYPALPVLPVAADFTQPFELPRLPAAAGRRVVLFSGSTIGNFRPAEAVRLLRQMGRLCGADGALLVAADLKKERTILEAAYNDRLGVTAAFNLNLLTRINRELHADFVVERFRHHAFYNARRGRMEMHLISLADQTVHLGGSALSFARGETVRTEFSYKYSPRDFADLAEQAGLTVERMWTDEKQWFSAQWLTPLSVERAGG